jgi:NAD(P)-dependent dehydrogenase (short-subunit alcohol dehydrogenase family)
MDKPKEFKDKVALVVGGASGMGNAVVRLLLQEGCRTHVFDVKQTAEGVFQHCDIQDYNQVRPCVQNVVNQESRNRFVIRRRWSASVCQHRGHQRRRI